MDGGDGDDGKDVQQHQDRVEGIIKMKSYNKLCIVRGGPYFLRIISTRKGCK